MALDHPVTANEARYRVEEVLELATALEIPAIRELACPTGPLRTGRRSPGRSGEPAAHGRRPHDPASRGNVWLVQNPLPCLPCQNEGCARRIDSYSRCLDRLLPRPALTAVGPALASARAAP